MVLVKSVNDMSPVFGKGVYLADNSTVIGDVEIGDNSSIWFNAVIRGDVSSIKIGSKVNIQDGVIVHGTYKKSKTIIGNNVSVGHNAILHGCRLEDNVLIGMGAILMDNVVVESNSIIAAGSVVLEGTKIKKGNIYAGVPAKKVKGMSEKRITELIKKSANNYLIYSSWF